MKNRFFNWNFRFLKNQIFFQKIKIFKIKNLQDEKIFFIQIFFCIKVCISTIQKTDLEHPGMCLESGAAHFVLPLFWTKTRRSKVQNWTRKLEITADMTARENSRLRIPITVVRANFGVIRIKRKVVGSIQVKPSQKPGVGSAYCGLWAPELRLL